LNNEPLKKNSRFLDSPIFLECLRADIGD
jgi:hypothetical protein